MENEHLIVAARMYGVDNYKDLPVDLYDKLEYVNNLCKKVNGGSLRSRQVIAIIVCNYLEERNAD